MAIEEMDKPTIFVSYPWGEDFQDVYAHIKGLIERAGMRVSGKMEKTGVVSLALKETINIMDAHGFCVIFIPQDRNIAPPEVLYEISTARNYQIPSFIFVDKYETGRAEILGNLKGYQADLNCVGEWVEFKKSDLLAGKDDKRILEYLKEVRRFIIWEYSKIHHRIESGIAALWAQLSDMQPFHTGLIEITEAYDKEPTILYDAAARAAAKITGAEFGYIGMLEHRKDWMEVKIRGFYGAPESLQVKVDKIQGALKDIKLGYDYHGETFGLTGHVCKTGIPIRVGHIQRDTDELKDEGKNVVDPGNIKIESELCVPIEIKGRIIGVIDVESTFENRFQKVHQMVLDWLSKVLAIAYSGEQLGAFIGDLSESSANKEYLAKQILNTLMKWSQADFGFIAVLENGDYCVKTIQGSGLAPKINSCFREGNLKIKPNLGLAGKVLSTGEAIYSEDPEKEAEYLEWFKPVKSEITLPIKSADGETIGVVALEYILPQDFRDVDKKLFGNIANLLAFVFDDAHKESK